MIPFLHITVRKKTVQFFLLWFSIAIFYLPAYKAGFVSDFLVFVQAYKTQSFWDIINTTYSDIKSYYHIDQFIRYCFISLFDLKPIPWFVWFTFMHTLNGFLVYRFFLKLYGDFNVKHATKAALFGMLLFVFGPNITEVTIWKATGQYLTSVFLLFSLLSLFIASIKGDSKNYLLIHSVYILSIFTLEIFYLTPFLVLALSFIYYKGAVISRTTFMNAIKYVFLPITIIFLLYLLSFKFLFGSWIAHYGTNNTFIYTVNHFFTVFLKYLSTLFLMTAHWPAVHRHRLYDVLVMEHVSISIVFLLIVFVAVVGIKWRRSWVIKPVAFLVIGLAGMLVLVSTTFFQDDLSLLNSRRCYITGLFFYPLLGLLITFIRPLKLSNLFFIAYFVLSLFLTGRMIFRWKNASDVQYALLQEYNYEKDKTVVLLNLPCFFVDVPVTPAGEDVEYKRQLNFFLKKDHDHKIYNVSSYNMLTINDGAHVVVRDSGKITVTLNQWGTWWMYDYLGAMDYENELYRVHFNDPGHEYQMSFKQKVDSNMIILFQQGKELKEVNMNSVGVEQW